jgi:hypothetical protein
VLLLPCIVHAIPSLRSQRAVRANWDKLGAQVFDGNRRAQHRTYGGARCCFEAHGS